MPNDATRALPAGSGPIGERVFAVLALCLGAAVLCADPGSAAGAADGNQRPGIDVLQVEGLLDPPNVSLMLDGVDRANDRSSTLLIIQLDSGGALDADVTPVLRAIRGSAVPVAVWVGPSGAEARGAAALVFQAAHVAYVSQGSSIGPAVPVRLDEPDAKERGHVERQLARLAAANGRDGDTARRLATTRVGDEEARRNDAVTGVQPTVGELIVSLDGREVETAAGTIELSTARVVGEGRDRRRQANQEVRFDRLGLGDQVLHGLISPSLAYALFLVGCCLIVFEFYTASIGLAGLTGAISLVAAFGGFSHLPVRGWALALLVLAVLGLTVDVQAGGFGFWSAVGAVALIVGSLTLYGGSSRLDPAWWVLVLVIGGTGLFMASVMTAMIRARFSTPTVGREGMVGEVGVAEVDVDPNGVVVIRGARWRARTNRATPISAGAEARVAAVEGLVLEVEPTEGAARDYRERARSRHSDPKE